MEVITLLEKYPITKEALEVGYVENSEVKLYCTSSKLSHSCSSTPHLSP